MLSFSPVFLTIIFGNYVYRQERSWYHQITGNIYEFMPDLQFSPQRKLYNRAVSRHSSIQDIHIIRIIIIYIAYQLPPLSWLYHYNYLYTKPNQFAEIIMVLRIWPSLSYYSCKPPPLKTSVEVMMAHLTLFQWHATNARSAWSAVIGDDWHCVVTCGGGYNPMMVYWTSPECGATTRSRWPSAVQTSIFSRAVDSF